MTHDAHVNGMIIFCNKGCGAAGRQWPPIQSHLNQLLHPAAAPLKRRVFGHDACNVNVVPDIFY